MKINQTGKPLPATTSGESAARSPAIKSGAQSGNTPVKADSTSVQLGATGAQLRELESSIASTSVVNSQKVSEIKQAISEGRFQVNTEVVADRLINTVQEMITASTR